MKPNTEFRHPQTISDPHPAFSWLRDNDPVYWSKDLKGWVLTRYADIYKVIRDRKFSVEKMMPFAEYSAGSANNPHAGKIAEICEILNHWAVFRDPPNHSRLRRPMNKVFRREELDRLIPLITQTVHNLIDGVIETGEMDLIKDFAYPLPASIIAFLLGLPLEDIDQLKMWSDELAQFALSARTSKGRYETSYRAIMDLKDYLQANLEDHRRNPRPDGLTTLLEFTEGDDGLSDDEVVSTAMLMLFAGHETTTNLIGNGMYSLIKNPDEMERLRADHSLIPSAVEEFMRYEGPVQFVVRLATEDTNIGDTAVKKGDRVFLSILSANRDAEKFDNPEALDIGRENNEHLAFGHGMHLCVGAPLARIEGEIAIRGLLQRLANFELLLDPPLWEDLLVVRSFKSLPIKFKAAR